MEQIRNAIVVTVDEGTKVAEARRATHELCVRLDFDDETIARAELIAVELANNVLRHARTGQLLIAPSPQPHGLEMIAIDRGPGIAGVQRAMEDGYSTAGTPGLGLGALKRQARHFDLFSAPGKGTVAAALVSAGSTHAGPVQTAVLSVPIQGETANGDSWAVHTSAGRRVYCVADGLGHGAFAAEASTLATRIFMAALDRDPNYSLTDLIQQMHAALRATRGAAVALFAVETPGGEIESRGYGCGVGNVSCMLQAPDGTTRSLASHNGTVGHQMRRMQEFPFTFQPGTLLVMHSDGLSTHWKLAQYPGLDGAAPGVIAGVLFRDAARSRDDATVLVSRLGGSRSGATGFGASRDTGSREGRLHE